MPYGELKHSGNTINCAPLEAASLTHLTALVKLLAFSAPTSNWISARRNLEPKHVRKQWTLCD